MRTSSADTRPSRWGMLRDLVVFQGKLLVDGLRDAVLLPVSLIAGLVDLAVGGAHPGERFYPVVAWGRRSERWRAAVLDDSSAGPPTSSRCSSC